MNTRRLSEAKVRQLAMISNRRFLARQAAAWTSTLCVFAAFAAHAEAPAQMQPPGTPSPQTVTATASPPSCAIPESAALFDRPLDRVGRRLAGREPIRIVAVGSSSTAGAGASTPAANYPNRLAAALRKAWPGHSITVVNRGIGGQVAADMVSRFAADVIGEQPDLVLWQVGTNSVLRDRAMRPEATLLHEGIRQLRATGADIVLIDPQFAPKVMVKRDAAVMLGLIASTATEENIALFRRYDIMRHWRDQLGMPFDAFLSPDGLHMNDWSYACVAQALANAIVEAASRHAIPSAPPMTARIAPPVRRRPAP